MKKFSALVLTFLVAVLLSACSTFHDDVTQTYPQDEPHEATVFLQIKDPTSFDPSMITDWKAEIERIIAEQAIDETDTPKIVSVKIREAVTDNTYTVDLTLSNTPPSVVKKVVRPFKIYYTQQLYNPIELLPANSHFTYIVGYTAEDRHSEANTDWIVNNQDDDSYIYLWTSTAPIEFKDVYPNRPLYYVIVIGCALVLGVIVYLFSRYSCKKTQKPL